MASSSKDRFIRSIRSCIRFQLLLGDDGGGGERRLGLRLRAHRREGTELLLGGVARLGGAGERVRLHGGVGAPRGLAVLAADPAGVGLGGDGDGERGARGRGDGGGEADERGAAALHGARGGNHGGALGRLGDGSLGDDARGDEGGGHGHGGHLCAFLSDECNE